ncbi:signal peptidase I [Akkermansiaceae bacterium]|nr:signal peptidase I [Akkermansiaceae bacterium]
MFAPKWKKEAQLLAKAGQKFLHFKRDLLKQDKIGEIESRIKDLLQTVKSGDKSACAEASKQLEATCENALDRKQPKTGWIEENLENIFVTVVIAIGIKAYILQPFRIPTGSMQPTLNGIVATPLAEDEAMPNFVVRQLQRATHGRTHVDLVINNDKTLRRENPVTLSSFLHFFSRTKIHFDDGTSLTFPAPPAVLQSATGINSRSGGRSFAKGSVLFRGYVDTGDLIILDKVSYHFRTPKRGEVFVFDTRDITKIHQNARRTGSAVGSHYIKRLAGIPGDELTLKNISQQGDGDLYINGSPAAEAGFKRVMSKQDGYRGYGAMGKFNYNSSPFKARVSPINGMNEYIALGDNSFNSSDSRDWGTVKEFNVMGPAVFSLWPFMSGHWGVIK